MKKTTLEKIPEFEEGAHSKLETHHFLKGCYPCNKCGLPYMIALFENESNYCKRASILIAKQIGTLNPDYKDDPWTDKVKVLMTIEKYERKARE